jgi:hypothetical protein
MCPRPATAPPNVAGLDQREPMAWRMDSMLGGGDGRLAEPGASAPSVMVSPGEAVAGLRQGRELGQTGWQALRRALHALRPARSASSGFVRPDSILGPRSNCPPAGPKGESGARSGVGAEGAGGGLRPEASRLARKAGLTSAGFRRLATPLSSSSIGSSRWHESA